ncbi:MAG: hypothetical protein KDD01_18965 [Phaeodactylibacter sp.]|nr:hypothetical protein [Phaeodactylibacter sp.]
MTIEAFVQSLQQSAPPAGLAPLLLALWHAGKDDWHRAHNIAQDVPGPDGAWVHAYLHRVEGDTWNANYWYRRAGRSMPNHSLKEEWKVLVEHFLAH